MNEILTSALLVAAGFGVLLLSVQLWSVLRHCAERPPEPALFPRVSILKPLCGIDDGLLEKLKRFAGLDYPGEFELLLGVRNRRDPAYPLARQAERWAPGRIRVVLQRGEAGLNPKVNQLV